MLRLSEREVPTPPVVVSHAISSKNKHTLIHHLMFDKLSPFQGILIRAEIVSFWGLQRKSPHWPAFYRLLALYWPPQPVNPKRTESSVSSSKTRSSQHSLHSQASVHIFEAVQEHWAVMLKLDTRYSNTFVWQIPAQAVTSKILSL